METDLGAVIQDSHSQVDVEMLTEAADVNSIYEEALLNLKNRKPAVPKSNAAIGQAEKEQGAKDYYANVRTNVRPSVDVVVLQLQISHPPGFVNLGLVERKPLALIALAVDIMMPYRVFCWLGSWEVFSLPKLSAETMNSVGLKPISFSFLLSRL